MKFTVYILFNPTSKKYYYLTCKEYTKQDFMFLFLNQVSEIWYFTNCNALNLEYLVWSTFGSPANEAGGYDSGQCAPVQKLSVRVGITVVTGSETLQNADNDPLGKKGDWCSPSTYSEPALVLTLV